MTAQGAEEGGVLHHEPVTLAPVWPDPIRILIVDDHDLYRRGMQAVLGLEPDLNIVAEAESALEAISKVRELQPDLVLLDLRMRGLSGIQACRAIKEESFGTKVVLLTASDDEADLFSAIKAGASGYVLKDEPAERISEVIRLVHSGQSVIPPRLASLLVSEFGRLGTVPAQETPVGIRLTPREREVLVLLARGCSNRQIAKQLFVSENTVKNHMRNSMEKLQVRTRVEAAMYALQQGLDGPEAPDRVANLPVPGRAKNVRQHVL